jgi:tripartite-type tricarboxylate transporter receptor subunit TctC
MTLVRLFGFALFSLAATISGASAQDYPKQTVRIVVPFGPGSTTDLLARIIGDKLAERWGQPVIVENRPGVAGTASVARSTPDGYTLMLTSNGHTIIGALNRSLSFDPVKDFAGITKVATLPIVLVVPPALPAKNLAELTALAKSKPGGLSFSSAGVASASYLAGELYKQSAKIEIVHVPYKSGTESLTSTARGDTQMNVNVLTPVLEFIKTDRVRAIAVAAPKRSPAIPDVPTFAEAGLFDYDAWFGFMAPANTPAAILNKVSQDIAQVLATPEIQTRMERQAIFLGSSTPAQMDATLKADTERYNKVLQAANIQRE